jgi:hypothetical protein
MRDATARMHDVVRKAACGRQLRAYPHIYGLYGAQPNIGLQFRAFVAGEYNLRLGIGKEVAPELVATHQGEARVLEGHAFIVEAAVSLGGRDIRPGINVYRFANRIPLLFEALLLSPAASPVLPATLK